VDTAVSGKQDEISVTAPLTKTGSVLGVTAGSFQGTLTDGLTAAATPKVLLGTDIRALRGENNIVTSGNAGWIGISTSTTPSFNVVTTDTLMIGATNVFVALGTKQDALTYNDPVGGHALGSGSTIMGLKGLASSINITEESDHLLVGIDYAPILLGKVTMDEIKAASASGVSVYTNTDTKVLDLGTNSFSVDVTGPARITGDLTCASLKAASASGVSVYTDTDTKVLDVGTAAHSIDVTGPARITGDLSCPSLSGDVLEQINPFWVAGKVDGSAVTKLSDTGRHTFTVTRPYNGAFDITWTPAHPSGANFVMIMSGTGKTGNAWNLLTDYGASPPAGNSSTSLQVLVRDNNYVAINGSFCFHVLA